MSQRSSFANRSQSPKPTTRPRTLQTRFQSLRPETHPTIRKPPLSPA